MPKFGLLSAYGKRLPTRRDPTKMSGRKVSGVLTGSCVVAGDLRGVVGGCEEGVVLQHAGGHIMCELFHLLPDITKERIGRPTSD